MALRQHYWNPRTNEACFVDETQLIYAFNERQDAGTWSDLHVHPDWGELLFVATGSIVLCSETGNFLGQIPLMLDARRDPCGAVPLPEEVSRFRA